MTTNSSANSIILILFAFSDNLSAENSKSSADFCIQLLECMQLTPLPHHVVLHIAVFLYIHATNNLTGCSLNGRFTFPLSGCLLALALALVSWHNPAGCSYFWLPTRAHPSPSWRVQAPDQMVAAE